MDTDAFRRTKGKGKKGLGKGKKGTGKKGSIHYMDFPDDFEDLAYYTKGRGKSKGRKGFTSRPWTPKGERKRFSLTTQRQRQRICTQRAHCALHSLQQNWAHC